MTLIARLMMEDHRIELLFSAAAPLSLSPCHSAIYCPAIRIIVITRNVFKLEASLHVVANFYGLRILCKAKLCDHWLMMTLRLLLLPLMIKTTTVMANPNCTSLIK